MKKFNWYTEGTIFVILTLCCIVPSIYVFSVFYLPTLLLRNVIKPYHNTTFLFEEFGYVSATAGEYTLFYWTPDSREIVQRDYQLTLGTKFVVGNEMDNWRATAYTLDGTNPAAKHKYYPVTYDILCGSNYTINGELFQCISLFLVSANQPNLCFLPIVSPGDSRHAQQIPYRECDRFPKTGTLIIYKFHVDAM